jgi:phage tail-like protein
MAGEKQDTNTWPLPKFYFSVEWGSQKMSFQEVTGLEAETQVIEYRHGNSPNFSTVKMPGIAKYSNVTMKRGIFVNDDNFRAWYSKIKMNTIERTSVIIKLLDEKGEATMQWTLKNAWPVKITGTDLKSDANEVAIETIEIAHEGLTITNS